MYISVSYINDSTRIVLKYQWLYRTVVWTCRFKDS